MILLIDNYGAFTNNLLQQLLVFRSDVLVRGFDSITIQEAMDMKPEVIVISTGPEDPARQRFAADIVSDVAGIIPLLGIGLGMHGIALAMGGKLIKGQRQVIGRQSEIIHDQSTIFEGLPSPLAVGRYDVITVDEDHLPGELNISAHTVEGEIMAVRHEKNIVEGLQFHPESVLTPKGMELIENFIEIAAEYRRS